MTQGRVPEAARTVPLYRDGHDRLRLPPGHARLLAADVALVDLLVAAEAVAVGRTIAERSRCSIAHAVSSLPSPSTRSRPSALAPFFWLVACQAAASQVVSGVRVLSKIVPAVIDVRRPHPAHFHRSSLLRLGPPKPLQVRPAGGVVAEPRDQLRPRARVVLAPARMRPRRVSHNIESLVQLTGYPLQRFPQVRGIPLASGLTGLVASPCWVSRSQ